MGMLAATKMERWNDGKTERKASRSIVPSYHRSALLFRIGVFDPAYFAYYEDVDLSLRARRAGSICWYVPAAVGDHRFAATLGAGSARQRYLLGRGHLRTLALHQPAFRAAALVPLTAAFRLAVKSPLELLRGRPDLAAAEARAGIDGARAALLALPTRVRAGIPRGAEPRRSTCTRSGTASARRT